LKECFDDDTTRVHALKARSRHTTTSPWAHGQSDNPIVLSIRGDAIVRRARVCTRRFCKRIQLGGLMMMNLLNGKILQNKKKSNLSPVVMPLINRHRSQGYQLQQSGPEHQPGRRFGFGSYILSRSPPCKNMQKCYLLSLLH
jgi:hypothetical protein